MGSAGVAYDATLISVRHGQNTGGTLDDDAQNQELIDALDYQTQHGVDVSNNSYGPDGPGPSDPTFLAAIEKFATEGRDGLGGIATFAAGNERVLTLSANLEGEENSPYVIPVAAVDQTGTFSIVSCFGANILVSAPGENIETTAPTGEGGSNGNYALVDGTSFATSAVSGVAALILEANPELTGKDVQEILAMSARHPDEMTSYFSSVANAQAARPGDDFMSGGIGNDRLEGGAGNDRLIGQDGNDRLFGDDDQDTLNGGEGQDLLSGGRGDDLLLGQNGDDLLFGFAGQDRLEGGGGDDKLNAGDGNDMVLGGGGDDIIVHGLGDDMIDGGAGTDVLEVGFASSNYRLDGSSTAGSLIDIGNPSANPGTDTFTSIEMVRFTDQTLSFNGSNWLPAVG